MSRIFKNSSKAPRSGTRGGSPSLGPLTRFRCRRGREVFGRRTGKVSRSHPRSPGNPPSRTPTPPHPTVNQVLEHLRPKGLGFFPPPEPETRDLLFALKVDPHRHKQGDPLDLPFLGPQLGQYVDEDGKPIAPQGLRLIGELLISANASSRASSRREGRGFSGPAPFGLGSSRPLW